MYTAGGKKTRKRCIPVRGLSADSSPTALARQLIDAHADLLGRVQPAQLERLMHRLVEHARKQAACASPPPLHALSAVGAADGDAGVDLNTLDDDALSAAKAQMDVGFNAVRLKPGDAGYEYDRRVVFAAPVEKSDWDDDLDDFTSSDEEDLFGKRAPPAAGGEGVRPSR
jgi:hypothetical protein